MKRVPPSPETRREPEPLLKPRTGVLVAVGLLIALRVWQASNTSLWLDELHSLAHAAPADVSSVLEHTHWDFHPPLFYLALHALGAFERAAWLRIVPILANLLTLLPLAIFARRTRGKDDGFVLAGLAFAAIPACVHYGTELRPYAWLTLFSSLAAACAFSDAGPKPLRWVGFCLATAAGVLTHYLMAPIIAAIGAARVVVGVILRRRGDDGRIELGRLLSLPWLIAAGALGACAFIPWLMAYADWMVNRPQELVPPASQGRDAGGSIWREALEGPLKTLVPMVNSLGRPWSILALVGCVGLALAVVSLVAARWAERRSAGRGRASPSTVSACTFAVILFLLTIALSILGWQRVHVRYLATASWVWPIVFADALGRLRGSRWFRPIAGTFIGVLLALGVAHAGGNSRENVRAAVEVARAVGGAASGDAIYTALLRQPLRFENVTPYWAYAKDISPVEPRDLPLPTTPEGRRPVVVITRWYRDLDSDQALAAAKAQGPTGYSYVRLRDGRRVVKRIDVDSTMTVWLLVPR